MVKTVIEGVGDRLLRYLEKQQEHDIKMEEVAGKSSRRVLGVLLIFLGVIIGLMVGLTMYDKVSGDALLFLTGTMVGWVLSIVYRHLFPTQVVYQE